MLLFGVLAASPSIAQERDDTHRLQQQRIERQAVEQERGILQDAVIDTPGHMPALTIDGQTYTVERNASELGQALYLSLQYRQWAAAQSILAEYLQLADRDPLLVHYAQGMLARAHGQFALAEAEFRALLHLQADFLPARLELARVLFESGQEPEAEYEFSGIYAIIPKTDAKTQGVRKTIDAYMAALARRKAWTGSISVGPRWSDNLNRSSASRTCLVPGDAGLCFIERELPKQIRAFGTQAEASLQRRFPLKGHHGLSLQTQAYGTWYDKWSHYNETSIAAQAGYSYRDARHQVFTGPAFTHYRWGNRAFYDTWGMHADWRFTPTDGSMIKLEGDYQLTRYQQREYARHFDGPGLSAAATYFRDVGAGWLLFAGLDAEDSRSRAHAQRYLQKGVRLGAFLQGQGYTGAVSAGYRHRRYGAYDPLIEARRVDHEQSYAVVLTAERWKTAGFVPSITLRRSKVSSNVGWLYSHTRNEIGIKIEYMI